MVVREEELGEARVELERVGERLRAAVGDAVAAEVEEDETAGLEVARVVGDLEVADAVEAEPEAGEACTRAGEDIRTCTGDACDSSPGMQVKRGAPEQWPRPTARLCV